MIYRTDIGSFGGGHEFLASDGSQALIILTVTAEREDYDSQDEHTIDPALAEVWPCVGRFRGHLAYAMDCLQGDALQAWLDKHRDDLVSLAWDVASSDAERHDEEMAERR